MLSATSFADDLFRQFDFDSRRTLVAAVSGGSDSMALVVLLHEFLSRDSPSIRLAAVTVDHRLRPESGGEAERVAQFCADRGIAHRTVTWMGEKPATGLSQAAREARYGLLADAAADFGTDIVLTGHTLDDQVETVRMRRARGTGRGMAGMAAASLFDGRCWIARPLLGARRADLRALLTAAGVGWADDPTNADIRYERPRLRAAPLEDDAPSLAAIAEAQGRRRQLGAEAARIIEEHAQSPLPGLVRLDRDFVDGLDGPAPLYVLRILLAVMGGSRHLPDETRAEALAARLRGPGRRATLSRCVADLRRSGLYLMRELRDLPVLMLDRHGAVWDGRFRVHGPVGAVVEAAGVRDLPEALSAPDVPAAIARTALATQPAPSPMGAAGPSAAPVMAPWRLFLPDFDLAPAHAVARLIGAVVPTQPPFTGHKDISA